MTYRYKLLFLFTALLTGIAGMGARETQPRVSPGIETLRQTHRTDNKSHRH